MFLNIISAYGHCHTRYLMEISAIISGVFGFQKEPGVSDRNAENLSREPQKQTQHIKWG